MSDTALYTDLSAYYDLMCSDINYKEQCDTAHRIHRSFGRGGCEYLDLACGTGPHVENFLNLGYTSTGLDINQPMLTRAAHRCPNAEFSLQDMSAFYFDKKFDLITCFLYSIHYCYPLDKLTGALECAFSSLNSGGVFCFDSVDKNSIANDEGFSHSLEHEGEHYQFQSRWFYPGQGDKLDLHLSIQKKIDSQKQTWRDQHVMIAMEISSLQALLERIGFEVLLLERDFTKLEAWNGSSGNVIVVCIKP